MTIESQRYNANGEPYENDEAITLTKEQVAGIAFQAAGCGSGAIMSKPGPAREVVMPSEEISAGVARLLAEHGIEVARLFGYASVREVPAAEDEVATPEARDSTPELAFAPTITLPLDQAHALRAAVMGDHFDTDVMNAALETIGE